jgi:hypothetical protein
LVVLPITISHNPEKGIREIHLCSADELRGEGYLDASKWFKNAERIWDIHKTAKSKSMSNIGRINYQSGLTEQKIDAPFLVLYNSSAKDANATVVIRKDLDLEFIIESKAYVFYSHDLSETYYLAAVLNSAIPNKMMKDFQSKGLFGARDIHKKILDVYFPKFDKSNRYHLYLAELSRICHIKTKGFLQNNPPQKILTPFYLGRFRLVVKNNLIKELREIDKLVEKLIMSPV